MDKSGVGKSKLRIITSFRLFSAEDLFKCGGVICKSPDINVREQSFSILGTGAEDFW